MEAARRATEARHLFERARDAWEQAAEAKAEPADLVELDMRATSAAKVDQHEHTALAQVREEREQARRAVEQARARAKAAREALERAEAAIEAPLQADRPMSDRAQALVYTWPLRVLLRREPGWELDSKDLAICRQSWVPRNSARLETRLCV